MVSAELLRRVVVGRLQPGSDGDSPDAQLVLEAAIDQFRPANTEDQLVNWYGRRWPSDVVAQLLPGLWTRSAPSKSKLR